jgi:hypothetical protein
MPRLALALDGLPAEAAAGELLRLQVCLGRRFQWLLLGSNTIYYTTAVLLLVDCQRVVLQRDLIMCIYCVGALWDGKVQDMGCSSRHGPFVETQ